MIVFLNGEFVPAEQAVVSVFDRSFLYGDGLFETMRVFNGRLFRWDPHHERMKRGAAFLRIKLPFSADDLRGFAAELIRRNEAPDSLLRLTLSRGVGVRGYSPKSADQPTLVMTLHPFPKPEERSPSTWKLITASPRLPAGDPLAQFKTCNKLPQVLARIEADAAGADEALLRDTDGFVVEGASSNLFWMDGDVVCTAPLSAGILPGITREVVFEICRNIGRTIREVNVSAETLRQQNGIFLSLSSWGIVAAGSLDGVAVEKSPVVERIRWEYSNLLRRESEVWESDC